MWSQLAFSAALLVLPSPWPSIDHGRSCISFAMARQIRGAPLQGVDTGSDILTLGSSQKKTDQLVDTQLGSKSWLTQHRVLSQTISNTGGSPQPQPVESPPQVMEEAPTESTLDEPSLDIIDADTFQPAGGTVPPVSPPTLASSAAQPQPQTPDPSSDDSNTASPATAPAPAPAADATSGEAQPMDTSTQNASGQSPPVEGTTGGETAAAAIGITVFMLLAGGAAVLALKRLRRRGGDVPSKDATLKPTNTLSTHRSTEDGHTSSNSKKLSSVRVVTDSIDSLFGLSETSTTLKVFSPRKVPPSVPEGANACLKTLMLFIKQQLDCFGPEHLLLGRYQLLGSEQRRTGGQSVVQFARRTDGTGLAPYAVKFFLMRSVYEEEADMYRNSPPKLKRFMPKVVKYVPNADDTIVDPFGNPLPPFIVMEKGESLRDRTRDTPVDVFTAAQVLGHVSERIAELHDAGYAHRDLKPGNIMWQPRTYTWVLIDFGLASPLDEDAPVGFTPTYAAPEMVIAHLNGQRVVKADAAVDAWSLGVIAFELLVQRHPFGLFTTKDKVFSELSDPKNPLPWEEGKISRKDKKKLGRFRKAIMKLLQRDPSKRATARDFCRDIRHVFAKHTDSTFRADDPEAKKVTYAMLPDSERSSKRAVSLPNSERSSKPAASPPVSITAREIQQKKSYQEIEMEAPTQHWPPSRTHQTEIVRE